MGINQAYASGGSTNSARSQSYSNTAGIQASNTAQQQAVVANTTAKANWEAAAKFNAEQARIQREWQERMANTVYQRTVKDMTAAGINPILAANMGLGTASVGSGATASMSTPQAFMGQTFAEQNSASTSYSSGSSWQSSENGIMTLANSLGALANSLMDRANSSITLKFATEGLKDFVNSDEGKDLLIGDTPIRRFLENNPDNKLTKAFNNIANMFKK